MSSPYNGGRNNSKWIRMYDAQGETTWGIVDAVRITVDIKTVVWIGGRVQNRGDFATYYRRADGKWTNTACTIVWDDNEMQAHLYCDNP